MSAVPGALARLRHGCDRFFFGPQDLRICAVVRIGYAALALVWLAVLYPDLGRWYSANGLVPAPTAEKLMPVEGWSLLTVLPQGAAWLHAAYFLAVAHACLLLLGFFSRVNAAALFVWIVSFCHRNGLILDSEDTVFRLVGFFLILMPCGARWSVDAWLKRRLHGKLASPEGEPSSPAAWGLRLLQIQMCVIFVSAGLCKVQDSFWQDGTAMYFVARLDDYFGRFPAPALLWQTPWLVRLISWSVVAAELLIPALLWLPSVRRWALAAAVVFHLANEYTMHLFLFHWIMLVGWSSFLTADDLDAIKAWFRRGRRRQAADFKAQVIAGS